MERLYFDYNATAPLRKEARGAMADALATVGNASSVHAEGRAARKAVEAARKQVAELVAADPGLVVFTSGGTEANNTVLTTDWLAKGKPHRVDALLVGASEHASVLAGGQFDARQVEPIPVDEEGLIDLPALRQMLERLSERELRPLVSVMLANNETGVIQPVAEIAALARQAGAIVHTDAVQAAGRIPVDIGALGVDVLTLSAHKIGGPQGAGAIVRASQDLGFAPLLVGGGQEKRQRAGTENVAAIVGFGAAAAAAAQDLPEVARWAEWRDRIAGIMAEDGLEPVVFGANAPRLPQTLCVGIEGLSAETLVIALDLAGVAVSSGSACSSGKVAPSHVLQAMGIAPKLAKSAIRVSLGWESTESSLDLFANRWRDMIKHVAPSRIRAA